MGDYAEDALKRFWKGWGRKRPRKKYDVPYHEKPASKRYALTTASVDRKRSKGLTRLREPEKKGLFE